MREAGTSLQNQSDTSRSAGLEVAGWKERPHAGLYAALLLVSMALLTLELALTRLFSFTVWYHFAYLTISMALLGFGSSGAIVASFPELFRRRGHVVLTRFIIAGAALTLVALGVFTRYPLEMSNVVQAPARFSLELLGAYMAVGLPFLFAGFAVSVPFATYPGLMGRLYFWDLLGAAFGCLFVVSTIEIFGVPGLVIVAAALMLAGAAALGVGLDQRRQTIGLGVLAAIVLALATPVGDRIPIEITKDKHPPTYDLQGSPDVYTKWTALSRVDAAGWTNRTTLQFWVLNGLMHGYRGPKPAIAKITYDGSNGSAIYPFDGDFYPFSMLQHHILKTPYVIREKPRVLVIGVGGGIDMMNAIYQGAEHVTGVELQPETVYLLKDHLGWFTGGFYDRPDVTLLAGEGRHFIRKTEEVFDLIQITAVDTFAAQATGAYILAESYLRTVESIQDYFARTTPDGLLSMVVGDVIQRDLLPPQGTRLALIGARALEEMGAAHPENHLMVIGADSERSVARTINVLVKKSPFTATEIEAIDTFATSKGFEMLYAPALDTAREYELSVVLGGDEAKRDAALDAAWFRMDPVWDSNPFFYNIAKWKNFSPERSQLFMFPGSFVGQLVLVIMMVQSIVLGAVLILAPLLRGAREGLRGPSVFSYLAYFLALGVGFMFIEISFVQSFVLFLGSPTHALSVTIFALLLFSSLGALLSTRLVDRPTWAIGRLTVVVAVLIVGYAFALAPIFDAFLHLELVPRILIAVAAQLPIGLTLGMFMPLGIACLSREHARLVPWAWGINGVGSVVGTTLAVILAMAWGFTTVAIIAAALYVVGGSLVLLAERRTAST